MGKKGKRTKWQALPIEVEDTPPTTETSKAVGYKKFRPFSTYHGDNSYKTAVLGPQRGFNSARQETNDFENGLSASEAGGHPTTPSSNGGYLTEKDQNSQPPSDYKCTSSASSITNGHHRYNRDYPNGGRNFSSYKSRYQPHQHHHNQAQSNNYASRDSSHSIHSNYSATHHKNSADSSATDASSTTSSSYQNGHQENGWRPPRHYNRPYNQHQYYGYNHNKENFGYASTNEVSGNDEYTRITTPRQDVLFKKGYLSRPKRLEEGFLGAPLISQQQQLPQLQVSNGGDATAEDGAPIIPQTDADPAASLIAEDNSPLYFCPGFVDHNGYFHANPTFMPNTFDQFGQPIVMMPYPPQQQPPVDGVVADDEESVPFETSDKNLEPDAENQASTEGLFVVDAAANELSVATAAVTAVENGDLLPQEGAPSVVEVPEVNQGEEIQLTDQTKIPENVAPVHLEMIPSCPEQIIEPQLANSLSAEQKQQAISEEEGSTECPVTENSSTTPNNLPLDPASSSFYPQSSMYPFYPMVFTPQQLPPNTSIIPLADLYYNENYAGLAAEIFGLTETAHIQSDDSTVLPLPPSSDGVQLASADAATVEEEEQENEVAIQSEGSVANDASGEAQIVVDTNATDLILVSVDAAINHPHEDAPEETPIEAKQEELIAQPPTPIIKVENAVELAANSNLKVDVEEFHPRIPNYPTPAQAAHVSHQRQYRSHNTNAHTTPTTPYFNSNNSHNHQEHQQYPRRRAEDDFRRRRFQENNGSQSTSFHGNRPPRRTFTNNSTSNSKVATTEAVPKPEVVEEKNKKAEAQPEKPQPVIAQKPNKSANNSNSKRAIQASIKIIEQQNIDLSKTKIAATQSSTASVDSNQWLVKTKGKKSRAIQSFDMPEDDMFENEEEIYAETLPQVQEEVSIPEPEPVIRASTPLIEDEPVEEEKVTKSPPSSKNKKSPNAKTNSPATKQKGKNGGSKKSKTTVGKAATGSKGFEVIEPDFGVITRIKTEPISLDPELQEELENILNMKDIDEQDLNQSLTKSFEEDPVFRSSSLPKSPRSEKDNVIDLDDLEALERSLMDFDLSGELKERMIEIIQSEMEAPLGGDGNETEGPKFEFVQEDESDNEIETNEQQVLQTILDPENDVKSVTEEPQGKTLFREVEEHQEEEDESVVLVNEIITADNAKEEENDQEIEDVVNDTETSTSAEEHSEQRELKIITSGMNMDEPCTGSSSSSSSLSSPIPTDDGRDGSNSESDDVMTPPAILPEDQEKKIVLPSQLEGRLFPREQVAEQTPEQIETHAGTGIAASVSKWLEEKAKESSPEPIFRIPDDPQVAKLIFKAMYGVDLALDVDDDVEFETEDDMDSLSADESDFEPDARDALKDLLRVSGEKRDNQVPIDTDSDYMSDGQNIKPVDVGKVPNKSAEQKKSSAEAARGGGRGGAKMCKVM